MLSSKCAVWDSKNLRFIKEQEASRFSNDIGKVIISPFVAIGKTSRS